MESEQPYTRYVAARVHIYRQLDQIRDEVDDWLKEMATRSPTVSEVAQLEAFHAQRQRLLGELQEAEERFLDHLVLRMGGPDVADGASPAHDLSSPI